MPYYISVSSCFDYNIPLEEQMRYVSRAGFTHISLGSDLNHSKLLEPNSTDLIKKFLCENNLKIDTIHFSQPLSTSNWQPILEQTMEKAKQLNCSVVVAHCTTFMAREFQDEKEIETLKNSVIELSNMCKKYEIKVALENLCPGKATDVLEKMLEIADTDYIGFCYDSSHDQIDGPRPMSLLKKWKHRLIAMHISDRIRPFTDHVTIGEGFIHFDEMIEILKETDISFPVLLEVMKTHSQFKDTDKFLNMAYLGAYDIASKIKNNDELNNV